MEIKSDAQKNGQSDWTRAFAEGPSRALRNPRTEFLEWLGWIHSKLIICTLNVALARTCVVPYGWNHPAKPVEEGFQTHPRFDVVRNVVRNRGRAFIYRIFIE